MWRENEFIFLLIYFVQSWRFQICFFVGRYVLCSLCVLITVTWYRFAMLESSWCVSFHASLISFCGWLRKVNSIGIISQLVKMKNVRFVDLDSETLEESQSHSRTWWHTFELESQPSVTQRVAFLKQFAVCVLVFLFQTTDGPAI